MRSDASQGSLFDSSSLVDAWSRLLCTAGMTFWQTDAHERSIAFRTTAKHISNHGFGGMCGFETGGFGCLPGDPEGSLGQGLLNPPSTKRIICWDHQGDKEEDVKCKSQRCPVPCLRTTTFGFHACCACRNAHSPPLNPLLWRVFTLVRIPRVWQVPRRVVTRSFHSRSLPSKIAGSFDLLCGPPCAHY